MNVSLIKPKIYGNELDYVNDAFKSNWLAPLGPYVNKLEENVKKYVGCNYAVATCSGTSAIHLALKCLGIKNGDIVFCPDFTFIATVNPVLYENATPVFIDCEENTGCISPNALKKAFEKYNAKAVIVMHSYGCMADMYEIEKICKENHAYLIEDGCEALGSMYNGKHANTFGDIGTLSFNGNKIITTTGGGMLLTNMTCYKEDAYKYATQSRCSDKFYKHDKVGYNYRLSNVSAAIGCGQFENIEEIISLKKHINDKYKEGFKNNPYIDVFDYEKGRRNNHWLSCIRIKEESCYNPEFLFNVLKENGIESRFFWYPMHAQELFKNNDYIKENEDSISFKLFNSCLCLPSDLNMSEKDIDYVIEVINGVVK